MKLHLPKRLFAAVLTAVMAVPAAYATTLSDAVLSLDGFTSDIIAAADGWTLTNVVGTDVGVYTLEANKRAELVSDTPWQTIVKDSSNTNRNPWSAIITFNINSLTNNDTILIQSSGLSGVGVKTANGAKQLQGVWQNGLYGSPIIASLAQYADSKGNVTVGVVYDGTAVGTENKGTMIMVGDQTNPSQNLKGTSSDTNSHILLSNQAGVKYSNLYLFSGAVSTADMQAMMSELSSVNTLTWSGTEGNNTWKAHSTATPWTGSDGAAAFTSKDEVTFGTLTEGMSSTVEVEGFVNSNSVTVNDAYTLTGNGTVSAAALGGTGSLSLGDNVTLAVTSAPTLAAIDGSGKVTISGLNQAGTPTNLHLADSWTGTVKLENLTVTGTDLSNLVKGDSVVELSGVSGYLSSWNMGTSAQNIKLTNLGTAAGFTITGGGSSAHVVFSGALTGDGNFETNNTNPGNKSDFLFTGNLTGFEGDFVRATAAFSNGNTNIDSDQEGVLQFGSTSAAAYSSLATAQEGVIHNIAGSGDITSSSVVRFNYADSNTLGIDNGTIKARYLEFNRDGGTANYEVTADVTGHNATAANNTVKVSAGTTTMKGGEMSNVGNIIVAEGAQLVFGEGSTLTAGNNINIDGGIVVNGGTANFGTYTVAEGKEVSITNTSGTVMFDGTITNNGTLNLAGNISFNKENFTQFELKNEGSSTWSDEERAQGFEILHGASYYAIKGGTTQGDFTLTEGITAADDGYVFTLGETVGTTYTINAATANLSASDTEHAESYVIAADSTTLTVSSGSFDYSKLAASSRNKLDTLVLDGGNASISSGTAKAFNSDVTINDGSTLTIASTDVFKYKEDSLTTEPEHLITVNKGGTLDFGSNRLSFGNEGNPGKPNVYQLVVNGGSVTGVGQNSNGALDYFSSGKIEATDTTGEISANVRIRDNVTLTVDVKDAEDYLKMSGFINTDGTGHLTKAGAGTLEISNQNTYGGNTTVNDGTLKLTAGGQDGAIKGTLIINEGGKVDLAKGDALGWGTSRHVSTVNVNGGELHVSVAGEGKNQTFTNATLNLTGGSLTGIEGSNIDLYSGSSAVHAKAAENATAEQPTVSTVDGVTLSLREASTTFTVDANAKLVLNTGLQNGNKGAGETYANALVVAGAGTLEMNAAGTYQGGTTINGGKLVAGHASALGTGAVIVNDGATLAAVNGLSLTVNNLTLNGASTVTLGEDHAGHLTSSALTVNGDVTINANLVIADQGTVTFESGTVTLGCDVTFREGATVSLGTAYLDDLAENGRVLLFTDVESYSDNLESIAVLGDFTNGHLFAEAYTAEGGATKFNIYATPEPTTATLSLLALAGLMARRKRH